MRDLRRFGVLALDSMALMDHESLDMLKRYNIAIKDVLVEAIAKRGM